MKRVLIFDSACSVCTGIARKVCNEAGELIHDVWSLTDMRAKKILVAAGISELARPAIIEITPEKTQVFAGPMFRWRLLRLLGPQRALKLAKVIAGDLTAADQNPSVALPRAAGQSTLASVFDRRKFVALMTSVAAGFMVVSGLGLSRVARAANQRQMSGNVLKDLNFTEPHRLLAGAERERAWERFTTSRNVAALISSRDFEAYAKAAEIRAVLLSNSVPGTQEELEALAQTRSVDEVTRYPFFNAFERNAEGGFVATVATLMIERTVIGNTQVLGTRQQRAGVLTVHRFAPEEAEPPKLLAQYRNGQLDIKTREFSAP